MESFAVTLVARVDSIGYGRAWGRLGSICGHTQDVTLTDSRGFYRLRVCSCFAPDTIASAVVTPDSLIVGNMVETRNLDRAEFEQYYSYEEDGFLCDDTVSGSYVSSYDYEHVDSLLIPVP